MKKIVYICIALLVLILASCNLDIGKDLNEILTSFDGLSLKRNEPKAIAYDDKTSSIEVKVSGSGYTYQWYESNADKSSVKKLNGKTESKLTIPELADGELKYYFCEVSKGDKSENTQLFMVANTGIPLLKVTTKKGEPVLSKEKVDGKTLKLSSSDDSKTDHMKYSFSKTNNVVSTSLSDIYLRGNFSYYGTWGKKSYNLKFKKSSGEILLDYKDAKKSRNWVLSANANDHSFMKNWFATRMATVINLDGSPEKIAENRWTPQQEFVDFELNGQYMGIYSLYEKIRFDKGRINEEYSIEEWYKKYVKYLNGKKSESPDINEYGFILEAGGGLDGIIFPAKRSSWGYALCDPDMEYDEDDFEKMEYYNDILTKVKAYEKGIMDNIEDALYDHDWEEFYKMVDLDSLVDFFLVKEFIQEYDGYVRSTYMWWNPKTDRGNGEKGKLFFGPIWDCDNCAKSDPDMFYLTDRAWISELMQSTEFRNRVKEKWNAKKDLVKTVIYSDYDKVRSYIDVSVQLNGERWPNLVTYDQWKATSDEFLDWLKDRYVWMDSAIKGL